MWFDLYDLSSGSMEHKKTPTTFQFVVVRVSREEHIWEEFLKAVSSIAWPVFYVRSY